MLSRLEMRQEAARRAEPPERPCGALTPHLNRVRFWQAPTGTGMQTVTSSCLATRDALPPGRATALPGAVGLQFSDGWCNHQPQPCE